MMMMPLVYLKGPKHEVFENDFLTKIRPLWLGDLGTGEKFCKFVSWYEVFPHEYFIKRMISIRLITQKI